MPTPRRRAAIEVHKFGGASLADAAAFRRAIGIVKARRARCVVVVSAPAGVTDALLDVARRGVSGDARGAATGVAALRARYRGLARALVPAGGARRALAAGIDASFAELAGLASGLAALRELTPRTSDLCVSRGERLCAAVFAAAMSAARTRTEFVDAVDIVETDGRFGGASPDLRRCDRAIATRLRPLCARGIVPVVPGFLGAAADDGAAGDGATGAAARAARAARAVVTLGRGGTDLTATLVGRALGAAGVHLWKDVPGLLTADPRSVPDARVIPQLHAREAAELAYYGAKVLHPRALIPLSGRDVPVFVRPFADPDAAGTEISRRRTLDDFPVKALSAMPAQSLVTIAGNGMLGVPGVAGRAFSALAAADVSVSLICQASSEQSICFTVPGASAAAAARSLRAAFRAEIARGEIDGVEARPDLATVAVVGLGMAGLPGIAGRVFSALAAARISVVAIAQGSSELNISFVVPARDAQGALRAIHAAFDLAKLGGGAAERRGGTDLVLLGCGQIGGTLVDLIRKGGRRTAGLRVVGVIDRSGYVFDPAGISVGRLAGLVARKRRGGSLARAAGGHTGDARRAVADMARHALARPVLVDLTAADTGPALAAALDTGMDLVLANKRPLAGPRADATALRAAAASGGRQIRFETTVGAGLPILDTFDKLVESGDRVLRIDGCLSGTLGFLLTALGHGRPFSAALRDAMSRGLTEPDPRDDLSGADVARKAIILGRLLGFRGEPADVIVESLVPAAARKLPLPVWLRTLSSADEAWRRRVESARRRGGVLRYVASVTARRIRVGLEICRAGNPFASLEGTDNQVAFTTVRYRPHPLVITGAGAGPAVTAGGLLNDVLALAGARR